MKPFTLDEGLDTESPKFQAPLGSLSDCLNYERRKRFGLTLTGGLSRYDGTAGPDAYRYWRLTTTSVTGSLTAGMAVYFTAGQVGYVLTTETVDETTVVYTVFPGNAANPTLPATLTGTGGTSATILTREVIKDPKGTQGTLNTALKAMADTRRSSITTVPGRTGTDVLHTIWLKNRLYAIRDLCRVTFSGGLYTDADEGHFITLSGSHYEILDVQITGENSGVLTIDCTAGSGDPATPPGTPTVTSMALSGTLTSPGYVNSAYSSSLTLTGGTAPIEWSIVEEGATSVDPIDPPDPDDFTPGEQVTNAALYKATASGWVRQDLGREMAFRTGGANISNFNRELNLDSATVKDTGYLFPTSSTLNGSSTTGVNADDGTLTALTGATGDSIIAKGFSFTGIPSTAQIRGIEVVVERRSDTANQAKDMVIDLVGFEAPTNNKAKGTAWPNTIGTATYGSSTDLWGNRSITVADLDSSFGVRVVAQRVSSGTATVGGVDYIKIKVFYVERETPAYVWDGSTDVSINIRHIQILGGDTGANTAYGYITLTAAQNGDKTRLINEGDEIRTAASGAGNLIAVVAGRDRPIWLPGQEDLDGNASMYQTYVGNFYYQDEYDAAYTVQGVGPCWAWDGLRCIRIRVPTGDTPDTPRHVGRHGERLMLGYSPGLLMGSQAANPFEMRGSAEAQSFSIPDRITGIGSGGGDAFIIQCESSIYTLRGYTAATFFRQPIKSKRGGIEYCMTDVGSLVSVDGQGIFVTETPEQMGPATRDYVSSRVGDILHPRLQAVENADLKFLRPIMGWAVRSEGQYRLAFWDGYVLTMTQTENGPKFTMQRYYTDSGDDDVADTPWPIRSVCTGYDSSGRERVFCTFRGQKLGYVFEMGVGRSFDGDPIPAYVVTNPIPLGSTLQQTGRLSHMFIYGEGQGVATIAVSRNVDYYAPDPTVTITTTMGSTSDTATEISKGFRGVSSMPIEGYDVTFRFDSETALEGRHTLQAVQLIIDEGAVSSGHTRAR